MAEDGRVPPLSRRIPGAAGGPRPAAKVVLPVLPESLLLAARAALSAEADEEEAQQAGTANAKTAPAAPHQDPPARPPAGPARPQAPDRAAAEADAATQPIPAIMAEAFLNRPAEPSPAKPAQPKPAQPKPAQSKPAQSKTAQPAPPELGQSPVGAPPAPVGAPPAPVAAGPAPARVTPAPVREPSAPRVNASGPPGRPAPAGPDLITTGPRRRVWLVGAALLALIVVAGVTFGIVRLTQSGGGISARTLAAERASRSQAAAWVASQVGQESAIACDPTMCRALDRAGVPSGQLLSLGPTASYPLTASIVLMTATVRSQFGSSLATAYAPAVLAKFGSGLASVEIRVISRDGARAYAAGLRTDISERKTDAKALLSAGDRIRVNEQARSALLAGRVGSRLIIALAQLASLNPITIQAFGDSGPGASPGIPLRSVDFVPTGGARLSRHSAYVDKVVRFLSKQNSPYRVASVALIPRTDPKVVRIQFDAPGPLGLLGN
jgi:hypothetical protein